MPDAVVIGAGPNGLVAANLLADAGWTVEVLEEQHEPGGAVRSDRGVHPDYVNDLCSSFYPLAAASPVLAALALHEHGLVWSHAPRVLAHPLTDGRCAVLERGVAGTAAGLEVFGTGDGAAWQRLCALWDRVGDDLLDALFTPFPPLRATARLAARLRGAGGLRLARTLLLPVRRLGEEEFRGEAGRLLLAGNALHADLVPEAAGSGGFGWLMSMLGQTYGFPVPVGGAETLTAALVRRLQRRGGVLRCGERVDEIVVRGGRAVAVRTAIGEIGPGPPRRAGGRVRARPVRRTGRRPAPSRPCPGRSAALPVGLRHLQGRLGAGGQVPWTAGDAATAGTVHLADGVDGLTRFAAQIYTGQVPDLPFALFGQMTTADATRSPAGTESAWAYTHVPHRVRGDAGGDGLTGDWNEAERETMADRLEDAGGALRTRIPLQDPCPPDPRAAHPGSHERQPARRGDQRRHHRDPPATRLPPDPRDRAPGDPRQGALPGVGRCPSGRRGARRARRQRRPRGAAYLVGERRAQPYPARTCPP